MEGPSKPRAAGGVRFPAGNDRAASGASVARGQARGRGRSDGRRDRARSPSGVGRKAASGGDERGEDFGNGVEAELDASAALPYPDEGDIHRLIERAEDTR